VRRDVVSRGVGRKKGRVGLAARFHRQPSGLRTTGYRRVRCRDTRLHRTPLPTSFVDYQSPSCLSHRPELLGHFHSV